MAAALDAAAGDVVVFLDADVANTTPAFVSGLLGPLLTGERVALVKGFYTRPLHGEPTGGGRVTELVARPVLELLFPELSGIRQPLAGETAAPPLGLREGRVRPRLRRRARAAHRRGPDPRARTAWPRSTWASASTGTGPCTSCAPRPSTCCAPRSNVPRPARWRAGREPHRRRLQPGPALLPPRRRRRARPGAGRRRAGLVPAPAARGQRHDVGLRDDGVGRPRGRRARPA